jgi:hypothetical protein
VQARARRAAGRHVNWSAKAGTSAKIANGRRFVQASQLSLGGSGIGTFKRPRARRQPWRWLLRQWRRHRWCAGFLNGLHYAPNAMAGRHSREDLLQAADLVRAGLAGSLRDYTLRTADGSIKTLARSTTRASPPVTPRSPAKSSTTSRTTTTRRCSTSSAQAAARHDARGSRPVQLLGAALVAFSQGVAYFHAGMDVLRSKSLDRNSFDSGDWFNRLDWTYQDNFFGTGLPPRQDNGKDWRAAAPILADAAAIRPTPALIAWMRDGFRDLLRIRASSTLFRMRDAADIAGACSSAIPARPEPGRDRGAPRRRGPRRRELPRAAVPVSTCRRKRRRWCCRRKPGSLRAASGASGRGSRRHACEAGALRGRWRPLHGAGAQRGGVRCRVVRKSCRRHPRAGADGTPCSFRCRGIPDACPVLCVLLAALCAAVLPAHAETVASVASPDNALRVELDLFEGRLGYRVLRNDTPSSIPRDWASCCMTASSWRGTSR